MPEIWLVIWRVYPRTLFIALYNYRTSEIFSCLVLLYNIVALVSLSAMTMFTMSFSTEHIVLLPAQTSIISQ